MSDHHSITLQDLRLAKASLALAQGQQGLARLSAINGTVRLACSACVHFALSQVDALAVGGDIFKLDDVERKLRMLTSQDGGDAKAQQLYQIFLETDSAIAFFSNIESSLTYTPLEWKQRAPQQAASLIASSGGMTAHWAEVTLDQYSAQFSALSSYINQALDLSGEY